MARIPRANFSGSISSQVGAQPTESVQSAQRSARSIGAVAQGISAVGGTLMNIEKERQHAADEAFISKEKRQFRADRVLREKSQQDSLRGKDPIGYTEQNKKWYKDRRKTALKNAGNSRQQDLINNFYNNESITGEVRDQVYENGARVAWQQGEFKKAKNERMGLVFEAASLDEMDKANVDAEFDIINSNVLSDADKEEARKGMGDIVESAMDGMYAQGGGKLIEAKAFLEGKTDYSHNLKFLDPKMRAKLSSKIENKIKLEAKRTVNLAVQQSKDLTSFVQLSVAQGAGVNPAVKQQAKQMLKGLEKLQGNEAVVARNSLENALSLVDFSNEVRQKNMTEVFKTDASAGISTKNIAESKGDLAALKAREDFLSSYKKGLVEDPVGLLKKENPTVPEGTKEMESLQKTRGILAPKVFSNETSDFITATLTNSENPSSDLEKLKQQYPKFNEGLGQIALDSPEMNSFVIAGEMTNVFAREKVLSLGPTKVKEINTRFNQELPGKEKSIENHVLEGTTDFSRAFGENDAFISEMRNKANILAKDMMLREPNLDAEKAAEQANNIIFNQYDIARSGESRILVPAQYAEQRGNIETFMSSYTDTDNLIAIEKDLGIDVANQPGVTGFKNTREFLEQALEDDFQYRLNSSRDGIIPTYIAPDGRRRPMYVKDGEDTKILNVKFEDMMGEGGKYSQAILDSMQTSSFFNNPDAKRRSKAARDAARKRNLNNRFSR